MINTELIYFKQITDPLRTQPQNNLQRRLGIYIIFLWDRMSPCLFHTWEVKIHHLSTTLTKCRFLRELSHPGMQHFRPCTTWKTPPQSRESKKGPGYTHGHFPATAACLSRALGSLPSLVKNTRQGSEWKVFWSLPGYADPIRTKVPPQKLTQTPSDARSYVSELFLPFAKSLLSWQWPRESFEV